MFQYGFIDFARFKHLFKVSERFDLKQFKLNGNSTVDLILIYTFKIILR